MATFLRITTISKTSFQIHLTSVIFPIYLSQTECNYFDFGEKRAKP